MKSLFRGDGIEIPVAIEMADERDARCVVHTTVGAGGRSYVDGDEPVRDVAGLTLPHLRSG